MKTITEKPMLFTGPMVKAILEGRKTQTRRIINPQPESEGMENESWKWKNGKDWFSGVTMEQLTGKTGLLYTERVPHPVGSRIWGKETFYPMPHLNAKAYFRATDPLVGVAKWTPSIYMPRVLSRILLEVTGVRVQRVQEISEEDAKAEGASQQFWWPERMMLGAKINYTAGYAALWDSINAKKHDGAFAWDENPWVWVYSFRRFDQ